MVALAVALLVQFFIVKTLPFAAVVGIVTVAYALVMLCLLKRKVAKWLLFGLIAFVVCVYILDFSLTVIHQFSDDGLVVKDSETLFDYVREGGTHDITWVKTLKARLDIRPFIQWFREGMPENLLFEGLFFGLLCLVITAATVVICASKWLKIALLLPLGVFVVAWYQYIELPNRIFFFYFVGLAWFFMVENHHRLIEEKASYSTTYFSRTKVTAYSLLLSLMLFVVAFLGYKLLPVEKINEGVGGLVPNIWGIRTGYKSDDLGVFSLLQTPYAGESGYLGGSILDLDDETPLFWLTVDAVPNTPIYLRSVVKDFYTGKRWVNQTKVYRNNYKAYTETPENALLVAHEELTPLSGLVVMDKMKTLSLFTPLGFYDASLKAENVFVSGENDAFYKKGLFRQQVKQYRYNATGYDFGYPDDVDYLQIGPSIGEDIYQLAEELGRFGESDEEKMQLLTQYLVKNYSYSLEVDETGASGDFVTNFVRNMSEGYCTYFASSLAIMGRINGIPTRYVEGFVVSPNDVVAGEPHKVTETRAHAWVEAYIEGKGWVTFEATPPYSDVVVSVETPSGEGQTPEVPTETAPSEETPLSEGDDNRLGMIDSGGGDGTYDPDAFLEGREREDVSTQTASPYVRYALWGGAALLALVIAVMAVFAVPNVLYLHVPNRRKRTLRKLYFLAYMATKNKDLKSFDVHQSLVSANVPGKLIDKWEAFLYAKTDDDFHLEEVNHYLKREARVYRYRFGILSYWRLKVFKIKKTLGN